LERNQTEKDLSNLDVISYKDTAVVLNARADDLQKRLSQIQQKYGIKKEVVVSKSVTPTPQAAPAAGMLLQFYDRYKAMYYYLMKDIVLLYVLLIIVMQ